jgi:hypothetical protein
MRRSGREKRKQIINRGDMDKRGERRGQIIDKRGEKRGQIMDKRGERRGQIMEQKRWGRKR